MVKPREIAQLRLAAQRIAAPQGDAADVVRWLTAVQGQDFPGALTSVALRTADRERAGVTAALDAGEVVRSWPMRGTLHLVPAADLGWMLGLTAERMQATNDTRRADLGITEADLAAAAELAQRALAGGGRLTRAELFAVWEDGGQQAASGRGNHLLRSLAVDGLLCYGPVRGKQQQLVLLDEWVPRPRALDRDAALREWALRYFRGHGPATARDFGYWTKLLATDVRTAVELAAPELASFEADGQRYYLDPATPELLDGVRGAARGVFLLPGFDEYLLGYGDRTAALPAAFADRVVPGGNGMFLATVVSGGLVTGTWKRAGKDVAATPFTAFTATVAQALPRRFAALP